MPIDVSTRIKAALIIKGTSAAQIARSKGVTRQAISNTIDGIIKAPRLRIAIARAISVDVKELWPDFKDRVRSRKTRKQSRAKLAANADSTPSGRDEHI